MTSSSTSAPTRCIGYVRVSTSAQATDGHSLAAQRHRLRQYAEAVGVELVAIEADEGLSAGSLSRPGLQRALVALESGEADGLLVAKLDRLTRSVRDLGTLVETYFADRYSLLSVGDSIDTRSAGGRLVLNVLASVSQWEREAIGERTREGMAQARREGVRLGAVPLGQRLSGSTDARGRQQVETDPRGAETVARIRELRAAGQTMRGIAAQLTAEGRRTARGGDWHASTVRNVLKRAA